MAKRVKKQRKKFKETGLAKLVQEMGSGIKKASSVGPSFNSEYQGKEIKIKDKRIKPQPEQSEKKFNYIPLIGMAAIAFFMFKK
jgi:hypothetical protein